MSDPSVTWLGFGFAAAWVLIGAYVVRLALAQRKIAKRLDDIGGGGTKPQAPVAPQPTDQTV